MNGSYERRVQAKIGQLLACQGDYTRVDEEMDRKRQQWWDANGERLDRAGPLPRQAYEMLLIRCMELERAEVPVIYEDDRHIVWRSFNFCPTLEACLRLGLDTRQVCRETNEASIQNLVRRLDPRLRVSRNYAGGIRPNAPYCEETLEVVE